MITLDDVERKREYVLTLEPSVGRSAALQILDDLEDVVRRASHVTRVSVEAEFLLRTGRPSRARRVLDEGLYSEVT